jgi:NAD(P)-dependent dehydrogenase (short-subunit alcohol dehydrogenase family)
LDPDAGPGRLKGRVAVVTGAGGGIGGATVTRFASEGAWVVAVDLPGVSIDPVVEQAAGPVVRADVTRAEDVDALFREVDATSGRLDILFNVVGISGRRFGDGPVHQCTEEGWDRVLDTNLRSVFLCCREAVRRMRACGGGSIINLGSVLGLVGHDRFDTHAYAASKGAVVALTRAMAVRYAADHIRVNVICPGLIRTPMSRRAQEDPEIAADLEKLQPLTGDFGVPLDVAEAALFLASEESRFVTGVVLPVDGGWTAR